MSLVCLRAEPEHTAVMAEFYRAAWDSHTSADDVRASRQLAASTNVAEPGVEPPAFLALHNGDAVGYVGTIPVRLWDGEQERPAYWIKGLMVLPTHRNGPIGFLLLREATRNLGCTTAFVVAPEARRLFTALGYADVGVLTDYARPLRMDRILRRLDPAALGLPRSRWTALAQRLGRTPVGAAIGRGVNLALRTQSAFLRRHGHFESRVGEEPPARGELDELWQRVRSQLPAAPVRDGHYVWDRYMRHENGAPSRGHYLFVSVYGTAGRGLLGVGILRRPSEFGDERLRGLNVATIADLVYAPADPSVATSILIAVERAALDQGADVLLCGTTAPQLSAALRRVGYVGAGGRIHFLLRDVTKKGMWPTSAASWWLTRGDSEADF